jgi:hypothetical protein
MYLGDVTALSADDQRRLIGVVAEVAGRHEGVAGTIGGTGTFDNDDSLVWWAGVHIPDLATIQEDLETTLVGAGFANASSFSDEPWSPHVTLAYLPAGSEAPNVDVAPFEAVVNCLTVAIGGTRYDLPLQPIDWQAQGPNAGEEVQPDGSISMPERIVTPFVPSVVQKDAGETGISVNPETGDEWRYTLGPVYIPARWTRTATAWTRMCWSWRSRTTCGAETATSGCSTTPTWWQASGSDCWCGRGP